MIIIIGLVILIAAVVAGVAGVLSDLIHQRESAYTASRLGNGDGDASPRAGRLRLLARRPAEAPASASAPAE